MSGSTSTSEKNSIVLALSVAEFCQQQGIHRCTFYRLAQRGEAPRSYRVGRRKLISADEARRWLAEREAAASPQAQG